MGRLGPCGKPGIVPLLAYALGISLTVTSYRRILVGSLRQGLCVALGCPGTVYIDHAAGLELTEMPLSASTSRPILQFLMKDYSGKCF